MANQASEGRLKKLERLVEINQKLSATLDLQELLQSIVDAAAELTGSEQASIARYFADDKTLRFVAIRGMGAEALASISVPLEPSISGKAFRSKEPVIVEEAQKDPRFFGEVDKVSGFETRSVLSVPMMMRGEATGVLSALNKQNGGFDQQDVEVLKTLASQAAIAIHNSQLLKESREAYQHLAELDEMKNNFIAITSHELRIPLGLILGHATYLKDLVQGEQLEQVNVIERGALRLKDVVEDLSQIQNLHTEQLSLRPKTFDLAELLRRILNSQRSKAEKKKIELTSQVPSGQVEMIGEGQKLHIALDHLLNNALAFTDAGGQVDLSLEDQGDWLIIKVTDTGIGIPQEDLPRIFERFYQVESHMTRRHGGMGLGLTVAKIMVELHGGQIGVESAQGKGSQFTIHLPKEAEAIPSN